LITLKNTTAYIIDKEKWLISHKNQIEPNIWQNRMNFACPVLVFLDSNCERIDQSEGKKVKFSPQMMALQAEFVNLGY